MYSAGSSSIYSEVPDAFPYVNPPKTGFAKQTHSECSFAQSDFIYDRENTLKKLYNTKATKRYRQPSLSYSMQPIHNYYNNPIFYPPACHHYLSDCMIMNQHNRINPCLYPINHFYEHRLIPQKLLYMQTDGTLGLKAIKLEKPIQNIPRLPSQQRPIRFNMTKPKRNSSYHESLKNRIPKSHTICRFNESSNYETCKKVPYSKSTNDFDGYDNRPLKKKQMVIKESTDLQSDSTVSTIKKSHNSRNKTPTFNGTLWAYNESLTSLDDFVRSPYHRITHNLDSHLYNTDYSTDCISVDSVMKPLTNFLNHQNYLSSTFTNSRRIPEFIMKPKNIIAKIGENAKFRCSFYGLPTPRITWYLNKTNLNMENDYKKFKIYSKNGYWFLKFFNLKLNDSGKITCTVENSFGKAEASANLIVLYRDDEDIRNSLKLRNDIPKHQQEIELPIIFNENILYKFDNYISQNTNQQQQPVHLHTKYNEVKTVKTTTKTSEEIRNLIIENLIMRNQTSQERIRNNQHLLTYRVNESNDTNVDDYVSHRIPVKRAQFDDEDDVVDINEVNVSLNDKVTITANNEYSTKSYWYHPNGHIIQNSDKYGVYVDNKIMKLEIPNIQKEDCGIYKCVKMIDDKEIVVKCNVVVKDIK